MCMNKIEIGGKCKVSKQCINDSVCIDEICECREGMISQDGLCIQGMVIYFIILIIYNYLHKAKKGIINLDKANFKKKIIFK